MVEGVKDVTHLRTALGVVSSGVAKVKVNTNV